MAWNQLWLKWRLDIWLWPAIIVIVILLLIPWGSLMPMKPLAVARRDRENIQVLANAVKTFTAEHGRAPRSLDELDYSPNLILPYYREVDIHKTSSVTLTALPECQHILILTNCRDQDGMAWGVTDNGMVVKLWLAK